jgi:hypothetical protein
MNLKNEMESEDNAKWIKILLTYEVEFRPGGEIFEE